MAGAVLAVAATAAGSAVAGAGIATTVFGVLPWATTALAINSAIGFVVSTGISQIGGRLLTKRPKAGSFTNDAQQRYLTIRSSVEAHKIIYGRARVSGPISFAHTVESGPDSTGATVTNRFTHMVIPLAGHEIDAVETLYLNGKAYAVNGSGFVTDAPYFKDGKSYVRVKYYLGTDDQAASPELIAECPDKWTINHRGRGIAYAYVRFQSNQDVFPEGYPDPSFLARGKKLYDPRTTLTSWSNNAALCIRDYLTSSYGLKLSAAQVDDTIISAAANVCDEAVSILPSGTQARYTCDGVVDRGGTVMDNLGGLITSLAGAVTFSTGKFRIHAAAYDTPTYTLDKDWLAGFPRCVFDPPGKEVFNAVRGTFIDAAKTYQPTDFPAVTNATYETQDGGERLDRDIELPFVNDATRAQRLGKISLEKARQGIVLDVVCNEKALRLDVWDVVNVTLDRYGFSSKPFRVMKWSWTPAGGISMRLQEESSASYSWNNGEATTVDPAPDTTLPSATTVAAPGIPAVTEELYSTRDGSGVKAKAIMTWSAVNTSLVTEYQPEYRPVAAPVYIPVPRTFTTTAEVLDMAPGFYDFRVKALNRLGVSSDYATLAGKEIIGLAARPADVTGLSLQAVSSLAALRWDGHPDLDVREGGRILIRHSEQDPATWEASYSIGEELGDATFALVPLKPGSYLLKAEDSSGLTSVNAVGVLTKNATVLTFSTLSTVQEDPLFTGTFVDTAADSGALKLTGTGLFDDIPDFDAIASLDDYGGTATYGTYTFASGTNNGLVKKVRLRSVIELFTVNGNDLIDSRTADIDDWPDFDGTAGGGTVDCHVEVRETDDDPTGSPAWGPWKRMDAADYEAWGLQYRAVLTSSDPAFNANVTKLRVVVSEVI